MDKLWFFLKGDNGKPALAIAAIVISTTIAISLYFLNRKRKSLVYEYLALTKLLSMQKEISGRVRILVDDTEVQDVGLVQIRISNTGTEPIRISEFVRPISFSVFRSARIIEAEVSDKTPLNIDAEIVKENQKATLRPTLLNSKNSLVIKLLIANFDGDIAADARIEGVELQPRFRFSETKWHPIVLGAFKMATQLTAAGAGLGLMELGIGDEVRNDYRKTRNDKPPEK
jgi:hypothetical protein